MPDYTLSLSHTRGPFTVSHSTPLTAPTAADLQSRLALLLCVALTVFADLFGGAVCVMCYVVLVSAGRNVLDSVPPTHCPPTHGRLCIYTSGSSRSPQSLCSFKSLSCIYPSALFLHRLLFRSAFLLQPNLHTHHAINKNVCIALHSERARRVSASEEKMLQSFFLIMSLVLYCSGRLASMFQVWLSTRKPQRQLWKSSRTFRETTEAKFSWRERQSSSGTLVSGRTAALCLSFFLHWTLLRRSEEHVTETSGALGDFSILSPPSVPTFSATDSDVFDNYI